MERKEYKRYSREFKLEAVRLAALGEKPKAQIARELGIRVNQLRKWRLEFEAEDRVGGIPKQSMASQDDPRELRRENARLREEIEILKKQSSTLRGYRDEASSYRYPEAQLPREASLSGTQRLQERLLRGS